MGASPQRGYNHNIPHRGRLYHVQSEDSGLKKSHIFSHIFFDGTIIASNKVDYQSHVGAETNEESGEEADEVSASPANESPNPGSSSGSGEKLAAQVIALMQASHKQMIQQLRRGEFDQKIEVLLGGHPNPPKGAEAPAQSEAESAEAEKGQEVASSADAARPEEPPANEAVATIAIELEPVHPESEEPGEAAQAEEDKDDSPQSPRIHPALVTPMTATVAAQRWLAERENNRRPRLPSTPRARVRPGIGGSGVAPGHAPAISQIHDVVLGHLTQDYATVFDDEILRLLAEG